MSERSNGVQKVTYCALKEVSTQNLIVLPSPTETVWNRGIEEQIINETDDFGEIYVDSAVSNGRDPAFTLTYGALTKEIMALQTGFKLATQADTGLFIKSFQVKTAELAPVVTGQDGFGMVADTAEASVLTKGLSVPLNRQPFATFAPATANSFAQGANGAFKFSNDLVTARAWVTVYAEYPLTTADVLTEDTYSEFIMSLVGILHDKTVFNLVFDPVALNKSENNETNFGADSQSLVFRITDSGCVPKLKFLNRVRKC